RRPGDMATARHPGRPAGGRVHRRARHRGHDRQREPMKRLFFVGFVAVVLVSAASPAFAHASLQGTTPTSGSEFPTAQPPKAITLTFNEPVTLPANAIQVLDRDGKAVEIAKLGFGADGRHVTATLPPLPKGTYVVSWRVVSDDSHPVQGAFTFG